MQSLQPLLIFLLIIALFAIYIFRKQLLHFVIALVLSVGGYLVFNQYSSSNVETAPETLNVKFSFETITSWFTTSRSLYSTFQDSTAIQQKLGIVSAVEKVESIKQAIDFINSTSTVVDSITLPTEEEAKALNALQQESLLQRVRTALSKYTPEKVTVNDQVPADATLVQKGLFTDKLAYSFARGEVSVYSLGTATSAVYVKELNVPFAPGLGLYMAKVAEGTEVLSEDFLLIGPLKAVNGNQLYFVPSAEMLVGYNTVFIYSPVLAQVYAIAPLK
jgi:hypothetical protein